MKNMLHKNLVCLIAILLSFFMASNLHAQTNPEDLWGIWDLEIVEITRYGESEIHTLESLYADKENLPRNMFTQLFFFDDQVGTKSTEELFASERNLNHKGSFSINDGILSINIDTEQPRFFTYIIEDELLKIDYTQEDTHFYLVYKLYKETE